MMNRITNQYGRYVDRQFHSLLFSGTMSMVLAYCSLLISNLVVGNLLGETAMTAVTLVSPYLSLVMFVEMLLSFGVSINISIEAGKGNTDRANQFFSQGLVVALVCGALLAAASLALFSQAMNVIQPDTEQLYLLSLRYYRSLMPFALFAPLDCLLLSTMLVEGDVRRLNTSISLELIINVTLCILFCKWFGIAGAGLSYAASIFIGDAVMLGHFRSKRSSLHFVRHFSWKDLWLCVKLGLSDASSYLLIMLSTLLINRFLISHFGQMAIVVFTVILNLLSIVVMGFDGVGTAIQPLVSGYYGENNVLGIFRIMRTGLRTALIESIIAAVLLFLFSGSLPSLYAIESPQIRQATVTAIRLFSVCMPAAAVNMLWSSYFTYTERISLSFANTFLRSLLFRIPCIIVLGSLFGLPGVWLAFTAAELLTLGVTAILAAIAAGRSHGRLALPLLTCKEKSKTLCCFDFRAAQSEVMILCDLVEHETCARGFDASVARKVRLLTEEYGMSVVERNPSGKVAGELTICFAEDIQLTFRDNGVTSNPIDAPLEQKEFFARRILITVNSGARYQMSIGDNKMMFTVHPGKTAGESVLRKL